MQIFLDLFACRCKYEQMRSSSCFKKWTLKTLPSLFKALADPNRMAIFSHLCRCSRDGAKATNVNEVSTCCDVDLSVVSRHLSTLKDAGVLSAEKQGKEVFYSVNGAELASALRSLADYVETSCCPSPTQTEEKHESK